MSKEDWKLFFIGAGLVVAIFVAFFFAISMSGCSYRDIYETITAPEDSTCVSHGNSKWCWDEGNKKQ